MLDINPHKVTKGLLCIIITLCFFIIVLGLSALNNKNNKNNNLEPEIELNAIYFTIDSASLIYESSLAKNNDIQIFHLSNDKDNNNSANIDIYKYLMNSDSSDFIEYTSMSDSDDLISKIIYTPLSILCVGTQNTKCIQYEVWNSDKTEILYITGDYYKYESIK